MGTVVPQPESVASSHCEMCAEASPSPPPLPSSPNACPSTARYSPPEEDRLTTAADVYCFGMCTLEIQTRQPPFSDCNTIEEVMKAKALVGACVGGFERWGGRRVCSRAQHLCCPTPVTLIPVTQA
jgi:hypothetical protein